MSRDFVVLGMFRLFNPVDLRTGTETRNRFLQDVDTSLFSLRIPSHLFIQFLRRFQICQLNLQIFMQLFQFLMMKLGCCNQGREISPTILNLFEHKCSLSSDVELGHFSRELGGEERLSVRRIRMNGKQSILILQFNSMILQLERNHTEDIHIGRHRQLCSCDVFLPSLFDSDLQNQ